MQLSISVCVYIYIYIYIYIGLTQLAASALEADRSVRTT